MARLAQQEGREKQMKDDFEAERNADKIRNRK